MGKSCNKGLVKSCKNRTKGPRNHRKRLKAKKEVELRKKRKDREERTQARKYGDSSDYSQLARGVQWLWPPK